MRHVFRLRKIIDEVKGDGVSESAQTLSYGVVNGTTLKYNGIKDVSQKLKLGNTVLNYEIGYKPSEHNTDDRTVQLKHATKYEPSSGRIDNTETLKVGIPKVGPLRPWLTVSIIYSMNLFLLRQEWIIYYKSLITSLTYLIQSTL